MTAQRYYHVSQSVDGSSHKKFANLLDKNLKFATSNIKKKTDVIVKNSLVFGGINSSVVIKSYHESAKLWIYEDAEEFFKAWEKATSQGLKVLCLIKEA